MRKLGMAVLVITAMVSCKRKDPLYCDEDTMCLEGHEACDLTGACTELRNTCLAPEDVCWDAAPPSADGGVDAAAQVCSPDAFLRCDDNGDVVACNSDGTAEITLPCETGCSVATMGCNDCQPSSSECSGEVLTICSSTGAVLSMDTCPLGCHSNGTRCLDVDPSNGLGGYLDDAPLGPDLVLVDGSTIDTDSGVVMNGSVSVTVPSVLLAAPSGGVSVRVFEVSSLVTGDLTINGFAAVAFVSDGDVTIDGHVMVLAGWVSGDPAPACQGGSMDTNVGDAGSGGGGFGTSGAPGGAAGSTAGRAAGMIAGNSSLVPIRGGCFGGTSGLMGSVTFPWAIGGRGGGAIQVVSRTRIAVGLSATGSLQANGGGGTHFSTGGNAGGGGGSGGAILLEAPVVAVAGLSGLTANGGSGSCGSLDGNDGGFSTSRAQGANCSGDNGDGGHGGSALGNPTAGANGTGTNPVGGGGGGAVGRIRINTGDGTYTSDGSSILSPIPSAGTVATR